MFSRNVTFIGMLVAAFSLVANAHATRYLVQFKSAQTFYSVTQGVSKFNFQVPGLPVQAMHLFNTNTAVTKSLPNVQLVVVESDDAMAIESLKANPEVALVEAEIFHPAPTPIIARHKGGDVTPPSTGQASTKMDMPWGISAVKAPDAWNTTRGAGARVMVLDTGVDVGHPVFVGQIEAVQNFTGGDATDVTDTVGHGSHVSGTILANGVNGGLIGVAPDAKLLMGKICTDQGCSNVAIASGLDWATAEKVDVVNMSLGGALLTPAESQALQSAEDAGVMVVAASGNDGKATISYPAASPTAFAVGAVDINLVKADFSNWGPQLAVVGPGVDVISSVPRGTGRGSNIGIATGSTGAQAVNSSPFTGTPVATAATNDLVDCKLGNPADFPASVKGKFALIGRGTIPFADKVTNAIAAGAVGALIYNNAPGLINGTVTTEGGPEVAIPAVMIEQSVGQAATSALAAGTAVQATIEVLATDYASFQGTSMATPHVTGVAALVRAANKSLTPAQVRALLKSTATALTPNDQNQMGSGIVNAAAAVAGATTHSQPLPLRQVAN